MPKQVTEGQLKKLKNLGVEIPAGITFYQAHKLIQEELQKKVTKVGVHSYKDQWGRRYKKVVPD